MFQLIETICIENGKPQRLDYHWHRMLRSWKVLGISTAHNFALDELIQPPLSMRSGKVKCRIVYDSMIRSIEYAHYTQKNVTSLKLITDEEIDYQLKFANRSNLESLYQMRGDAEDILIVKNGLITDTSYANIVFRAGHLWFTPALPLLRGTRRQLYLDQNRIIAKEISPRDLIHFEEARIINAMIALEESSAIDISNIHF